MIMEGRSFDKFGGPCTRMRNVGPKCSNCGEGSQAHQDWWTDGRQPGSPSDPMAITLTRCQWGRVLLVLRRAGWEGPITTCMREAVLEPGPEPEPIPEPVTEVAKRCGRCGSARRGWCSCVEQGPAG